MGSELIEVLSLDKLVNQSRSLCHIVSSNLGYDKKCWEKYKYFQSYVLFIIYIA